MERARPSRLRFWRSALPLPSGVCAAVGCQLMPCCASHFWRLPAMYSPRSERIALTGTCSSVRMNSIAFLMICVASDLSLMVLL
eukprot:352425-Chlamydomonas_euryale.AAC.1